MPRGRGQEGGKGYKRRKVGVRYRTLGRGREGEKREGVGGEKRPPVTSAALSGPEAPETQFSLSFFHFHSFHPGEWVGEDGWGTWFRRRRKEKQRRKRKNWQKIKTKATITSKAKKKTMNKEEWKEER